MLNVKKTVIIRDGKHVLSAVPACCGSIEQAELLLDIIKKIGLTSA